MYKRHTFPIISVDADDDAEVAGVSAAADFVMADVDAAVADLERGAVVVVSAAATVPQNHVHVSEDFQKMASLLILD